jgi:ABC-type dipeptide/oligopeptide/nickel transport system permease subunit
LFEEYPWLLVPIIVVTVEAWNLTKAAVRQQLKRRRERKAGGPLGRG